MVAQHYRWDFIGLSTDTKPTPQTSEKVVDGSTFYCSDNSKLYVFCGSQWYEKTVSGGGQYELPIASAETLGGVKVGSNLSIDAETGVLSATNTTYTAGSNVSISDENVISATDTTYSNFTGTDGTSAGTAGLVPAPATTDAGKFLKADGTWDVAGGGGVTPVQTTGTSTTDVMSQDATTKMLFPDITNASDGKIVIDPTGQATITGGSGIVIGQGTSGTASTTGTPVKFPVVIGRNTRAYNSIAIGNYINGSASDAVCIGGTSSNATQKNIASGSVSIGFTNTATSQYSTQVGYITNANASNATAIGEASVAQQEGATALGKSAECQAKGSVSLGTYSTNSVAGTVSVNSTDTQYGYNSSNYRKITGVHDGENLHDCATVAQANLLSTSAPTTSTVGVLGQLYTDTTNMHTYQCTAIDTTNPSNPSYTWTQRW